MLPTTTSPLLRPWRTLKVSARSRSSSPSIVLEGALDAERGVDGPLRMVLVGDRRAEERHDAVTEELVHRALVAVDLGQHELERALHQRVHVLGVEPRRERGEAGDVHEEDGDLLALALEGGLGGEDAVGEVLGGVRAGLAKSAGAAVRRQAARSEDRTGRRAGSSVPQAGARGDEARATARAEPRARGTVLPAPGAFHACPTNSRPPRMVFATAVQI